MALGSPPALHGARSWGSLVDSLAQQLTSEPPGPFELVRVVVASPDTGKVLSQQLASKLPGRISSGIEFLTFERWLALLAEETGLEQLFTNWLKASLELNLLPVLREAEKQYEVLHHHINLKPDGVRRRQRLARRTASSFIEYCRQDPQLIQGWLAGQDNDSSGKQLDVTHAWQPAAFRELVTRLGSDPITARQELLAALLKQPTLVRTAVFALPKIYPFDLGLVAGLLEANRIEVWALDSCSWAVDLGLEPAAEPLTLPTPVVEVFGSHDKTRQCEVLRDVLTGHFSRDEALQPRDVVVVVPDPALWWDALRRAFNPGITDAHPARSLRLATANTGETQNPAVAALDRILKLPAERATASELGALLSEPIIANRWGLQDRDQLVGLIKSAEIRWGLDANHRASHGMPEISQNTWVRGLDRLLVGVALSSSSSLPVTGVSGIPTTDLAALGGLCEVISRLRQFLALCRQPADLTTWRSRIANFVNDFFHTEGDHTSQVWLALEKLTKLAATASAPGEDLALAEFRELLTSQLSDNYRRPSAAGGNIQVISSQELPYVPFRVACLLGFTDSQLAGEVNEPVLGYAASSHRKRVLESLVSRARSCERLSIVFQSRSEITNQSLPQPSIITSLLRALGTAALLQDCPLSPSSQRNYLPQAPAPSFDQQGFVLAQKQRTDSVGSSSIRRREQALTLPVSPVAHQLSPTDLSDFLKDPAKVFLRYAGGSYLNEDNSLQDSLPVKSSGLERWQLQHRLLTAWQQEIPLAAVEQAEAGRESLPPGRLGQKLLRTAMQSTHQLWEQAKPMFTAPAVEHPVDLSFGEARLLGTIRTRDATVVSLTATTDAKALLQPWVELLILARLGIRATGVIHQLGNHYGESYATVSRLHQPPPAEATKFLEQLVQAALIARQRLVPMPLNPGLQLASEIHSGRAAAKGWWLATTSYDSVWAWRAKHWELFYEGLPAELRDGPSAAASGGFVFWVKRLLVPFQQARGLE